MEYVFKSMSLSPTALLAILSPFLVCDAGQNGIADSIKEGAEESKPRDLCSICWKYLKLICESETQREREKRMKRKKCFITNNIFKV